MEEALRLIAYSKNLSASQSFNPCFNGRGVKTTEIGICLFRLFSVSILVLMEEALRLTGILFHFFRFFVSILVLMEEALRPIHPCIMLLLLFRFNPCFNGRGVKTYGQMPYYQTKFLFQSLF